MTWTDAIITAAIGAIAAILTSLLTTILQGWKWKSGEQPKTVADAANVITDASANVVTQMRTDLDNVRIEARREIELLRGEVKLARAETEAVRRENVDLKAKLEELEDVRDWAERLTHQVISLGGTPVKMRGQ